MVSLSFNVIGINATISERSNKYLNIESLKYSKGLISLNCSARSVNGNISALENLTLLKDLNLQFSNISGDINSLKNLTALTFFNINNTQVSGNISNLNNLTALTGLNLGNTQVSGDINALNNLTALTGFNIFNTNTPIIGSINSLSGLSKLLTAQIKYSQLSGDLATLPASCRFISFQNDAGSTFTWGTRSSSAKIIAIEGNASLTNIDKMLQDQAQCQIGFTSSDIVAYKTISVAGNRTSASDDAVATLQQKGYTISIEKA